MNVRNEHRCGAGVQTKKPTIADREVDGPDKNKPPRLGLHFHHPLQIVPRGPLRRRSTGKNTPGATPERPYSVCAHVSHRLALELRHLHPNQHAGLLARRARVDGLHRLRIRRASQSACPPTTASAGIVALAALGGATRHAPVGPTDGCVAVYGCVLMVVCLWLCAYGCAYGCISPRSLGRRDSACG